VVSLKCHPEPLKCHSEPLKCHSEPLQCHSERSEESALGKTSGKLRQSPRDSPSLLLGMTGEGAVQFFFNDQ
jgi:hypothetical protein